ncbi:dCTP deaminase [Sinorhizobium saheli]|uniref:dCTP deaminase n=1 Tax=Sinorhizobium saheli TaxID=36856 RepID=A0A178YRJ1_SINSA|nr:dCTP deaminase [Sinorhizobium saheli]MQW90702.1 dCTP deaminase [Sinorhizobium saheli]OAP50084.1 dCTP deaminase [Sinorhizobium saheli]
MIKVDILERLNKEGPTGLWIDPLLEESQIGEVTVDLRLGYDFLVSIVTRRPYIGITRDDDRFRAISSYFQPTRRELGDRFILYPDQVVLATTLEYIALPSDCYADLLTRSSYTRLGISVGTMVQPGFRGCFSVELFNHGNNPIELVVGAKMFQMRLVQLSDGLSYGGLERKYFGNVRPTPSRAADDDDLARLRAISEDQRG